jgi:uncharacterized membrane protein YhfC
MEIFIRALNALLMIALPLVLGVYLTKRSGVAWKIFGIGAIAFILSQIFHISFNYWVLSPGIIKLELSGAEGGLQLVIIAVLYGLSAGMFEETARFLTYRYWLKDSRNWRSALMLGAGHGGIEAILFGALALYALTQALVLRDADLGLILPEEQIHLAQTQLQAYWSLPWHLAIMGAVERVGALCIHLSASIFVLQAFRRNNILWVGVAILWHTLVNALALISLKLWGVYITEGIVLFLGAVGIATAFLLRDNLEEQIETPFAPPTPKLEFETPVISGENLDDSRYIS